MHSSYPQPPTISWTATQTNMINAMPTLTSTVQMPYMSTPHDVEAYLLKMEYVAHSINGHKYWMRPNQAGYMTWEQAVIYCLVKPWLVSEETGGVDA